MSLPDDDICPDCGVPHTELDDHIRALLDRIIAFDQETTPLVVALAERVGNLARANGANLPVTYMWVAMKLLVSVEQQMGCHYSIVERGMQFLRRELARRPYDSHPVIVGARPLARTKGGQA